VDWEQITVHRAPASDFVVAGNNTESLFGACESFWRKDMEPEELFETISQCMVSGTGRDCLAGWGAVVHVMCVPLDPSHAQ
jgi:20S proteasome subunit beta 3